jgi:Fur family zinc uptake transcriptional regulator
MISTVAPPHDVRHLSGLLEPLRHPTSSSMAHAHNHTEPQGADLTVAAQTTLEKAGEQWTSMRASVFAALAGFEKPASAYDIAEAVSKVEGRRVAANSVYRILDLFVGANLARRVESANAYVANAHPDCLHDCIFLVCDSCGQTTHLDNDIITRGVRNAAEAAGFLPVRPVIEVRGRCAECQAR